MCSPIQLVNFPRKQNLYFVFAKEVTTLTVAHETVIVNIFMINAIIMKHEETEYVFK